VEAWLLQVKCPAAFARWITVAVGESRADAASRGAHYYKDYPCPCPIESHDSTPDQVRVVHTSDLSEEERDHVIEDLGWLTERFAEMWA
jgi:hypothetical protein